MKKETKDEARARRVAAAKAPMEVNSDTPKRRYDMKTFHSGICEICKQPFVSRMRKARICKSIKCKNTDQRIRAKAAYDAMTPEERKEYRRKKYRANASVREKHKKPRKKVIGICPTCHTRETHNFPYGYIGDMEEPWLFCKKCRPTPEDIRDMEPHRAYI